MTYQRSFSAKWSRVTHILLPSTQTILHQAFHLHTPKTVSPSPSTEHEKETSTEETITADDRYKYDNDETTDMVISIANILFSVLGVLSSMGFLSCVIFSRIQYWRL